MKNIVKNTFAQIKQEGSFTRNFAVSFTGTTLVTAIGLLTTPIISRLYSPVEYGQLSIFNSVINNIVAISMLAYTNAIPLPKYKGVALLLAKMCFILALCTFLSATGVLVLFIDPIAAWLNVENNKNWLYIIPVSVFIYSINMIFNSWLTRYKKFEKKTVLSISTSIISRGFTISYGFFIAGQLVGLLLGDFINKISELFGYLLSRESKLLSARNALRNLSVKNLWRVAKWYREFPLYMMTGGYISMLSYQFPIFILNRGFGSAVVGFYSFSISLLELPINLIGSAIAPVFYQKASETQNNNPERLSEITLSLYYKMLYLGLFPFGVITIFGDLLFGYVFGKQWITAGLFTGYLGYYYVFKLTSQSTSYIYTILKRQRYQLIGNIILMAARAVGLAIGIMRGDVNEAMLLFGLSSLVCTFMIDMHILHLLKLPVLRIAARSIFLLSAVLLLLKLLRLGLENYVF
ncbi:lipopolysaccharide biosynthesis protein [Hymenobacter properus]|uniref:Oligosaccharide flippase family protein n=1 Tax=Hymenobacter properus TaxID=2791026 RepID=A0A931BGD5_9BACT|nr:oligosaccharide flippase family protein [Hymenobacter properus]MBF9143435.1 oligosaccharide flippase family protein [Hymenobacter properus]MBR7722248.1 oligosaccharide flippase family protein [Microvirga sp. SRT04]